MLWCSVLAHETKHPCIGHKLDCRNCMKLASVAASANPKIRVLDIYFPKHKPKAIFFITVHHHLLVLSPLQSPNASPVSPTHSLTPSTATLTSPLAPRFRPLLPESSPKLPSLTALGLLEPLPVALALRGLSIELIDPRPNALGLLIVLEGVASGELGFVAYSEPIEGRMFSPADKETKRENGTSQTWRKKNEAISVKDGRSEALPYILYDGAGGLEKCRNHR